MARNPDGTGAKIGPRIATLVTEAHAVATRKSLPLKHRLAMQVQHDFFNLVGHEIEANAGEIFDRIADNPHTPAHYKKLLGFMARGYGQWQTMVASMVVGQTLSPSILQILNNDLAPAVYHAVGSNPNTELSATQLAEAFVRNLVDQNYLYDKGNRNGLNNAKLDVLANLATNRIDPTTIIEALRRGVIGELEATQYLILNGMDPDSVQITLQMKNVVQSPAVLAEASIKGLINPDEAARQAALSGMDKPTFELLTIDTGDSLDVTSLMEAYRRGIIDQTRLVHGIRTGLLRDEWVDVVEALRFSPPPPSDAINAAVQNHLPIAEAKAKAGESGLNPIDFDWLYQTYGSPLSFTEMINLYHRGLATEAQVKQAIKESHTKDKYVDLAFELKRTLIPARQIVQGIAAGAITKAEATQRLLDLGYIPADAALLVSEGVKTKKSPHRDLAYAQVVELFVDQAITEGDAIAALATLGYDLHAAKELLAIADARTARAHQRAVIEAIRVKYVTRQITETTAQADLDKALIAPAEVARLFALWALEMAVPTKHLTVPQLGKLVKAGALSLDDFLTRVTGLGYSAGDAQLLAVYEGIATPTTGGTRG